MNYWIALIASLPTENATARMRAWRTLKSSGAAVLRDGVYLMPAHASCTRTLNAVAAEIRASQGNALVVRLEEPDDGNFAGLFDRSSDYASLLSDIELAKKALSSASAHDVLKQTRKLRKTLANLIAVDFFPGEARNQTEEALGELERSVARILSPDEPLAVEITISRLNFEDYQGRIWATRERPWVDRLASAWLIRRFIDPQATILWLKRPGDCPRDALGFDFDGASFTHVGARVTFEVLLASFGLDNLGLHRLGGLVHFLDVGGIQPPEAAGVESSLAGLRTTLADDDQLLAVASSIFDGLLASFEKESKE